MVDAAAIDTAVLDTAALDTATIDTSVLEDRGWVRVDGMLTEAECAAVVAASTGRHWPARSHALAGWVDDPRWTQLVAPVLGRDACFLREQLVTKPPEAETSIPWHQDAAYSPLTEPFLTCFVALEPITEDNGCLWMDSGSHRRGAVEHVPSGYLLTTAAPPDEAGDPIPLACGSAVVFWSHTIHRSLANRTPGLRPAWMLQFAATTTPTPPSTPERSNL